MLLSVILSLLVLGCGSQPSDNKDDWIDPYDMEHFDHETMSMKYKQKTETSKEAKVTVEKAKPQSKAAPKSTVQQQSEPVSEKGDNPSCPFSPCVPLFRQYVKSLLHHVKAKVFSGAEDLNMRIKMTAADVEYLEKYTSPEGLDKHFHLVHEILTKSVKHVTEVTRDDPTVHRLWIESATGMQLEKLAMLIIMAVLIFLALVVAAQMHFSWWKLTVKLVFFLFVISVFWQWYELYKKEETKQHMTIVKEMPEECRQHEKDASMMATVWRSLTSVFTFKKDECLQYYEHLLIDPFWKVTPTQALAKTLIRFFVSPAQDIGEAIQAFLVGVLKDLPAQLWPVALTGIGVFSFLFLFMYFGYRVSLPFGLIAIEPGSKGDDSKVRKALTDHAEELKSLKQSMDNQSKNVLQALQEALQQQSDNRERILSLPQFQPHPPLGAANDPALRGAGEERSESKPVAAIVDKVDIKPTTSDRFKQHNDQVLPESGNSLKIDDENADIKPCQNVEPHEFSWKGIEARESGVENVKCPVSDIGSFEKISTSQLDPDTIGQRDS